ncbi:relaxase/mobilization nuclease domain-containing protein [Vibrio parahaemolyticus]|uniref:TraI/MobA(P) family conjugative relaxase n=1 Tax=Vibrio parahaemolyticus TaxID=670 RepID=UPI00046FAF24|nr:TraI/MobA(P) family conjugative relaxase [Vibrio parahaemolyticus]MCR9855856.1 relaxase/mobilization nuclease domain-containing protein [Vibrio parahaemolyticus]MDF4896501.1 relaxase/mobilization nuclease domain-containing protein [Vibrio parahaemolyticus]MDK9506313.1 relaxase/mobilization nuclease domain-containing protein [Vibrio parahaemolyticus]MQP57826.1 relaxase/mobilization nuclease domain-containing protein [Vibrio parahaemolyticus]MQZ03416.1 relaxase/mobilization nuclease domain-co
MIVEEIKSKKTTRSLQGLINYMLDTEHNGEKLDYSHISNCYSVDTDMAVVEMDLIQRQNTRTKLDKTLHLVVSFPEGEIPTREQLDDIEQTLSESIGMGHHQRLSVAHSNTENYHLHMAINRIDPETHKMVNPYNYHKSLMVAATELELKHGLEITERQPRSLDALTMDYHSGEQSLHSWCQEHLKDSLEETLKHASSWQDVHSVFDKVGLSLKKSGRGLVVYNQDNDTAIKASSLSRNLSLTQLQKSLGCFSPGQSKSVSSKTRSAMTQEKKQDPLFAQYEAFKKTRQEHKQTSLDALRDTVSKQRLLAKAENIQKRQKVKDGYMTSQMKFESYKRLGTLNKARLATITKSYAEARKRVYTEHGNVSFQQYLCLQAASGNEDALARLRSKAQLSIQHQGLSGQGDKRITQFDSVCVDKRGVLAYQVGDNTILDNGKQLTTKGNSLVADKQLLEMAVAKYGQKLTLHGSDEFQARIREAAKTLNMNVTFNGEAVNEHGRVDPIQQFIDKRNQDRERISSIAKHERFDGQSGRFTYQGYRNIGQQSVVLLKQGETLYVKSVPRKEVSSYRQLKVGAAISIDSGHSSSSSELER